jgi:hypothetical protein
MASDERSLEDRIKSITAVISAIGGVLAALPGLFKNCREVVKEATDLNLPPWAWLLIALGLLILCVALAIKTVLQSLDKIKRSFQNLTKLSRLRRPDALWLRADRPEHLVGREGDVERLTELCKDFRLIFLVGESGAGKSALLQSGLVPSWAESKLSAFVPIYLDVWGEDWEKGPRQSLCGCVFKALSANDREILNVREAPEPEKLVELLGTLRASLKRTPVMLLDQLDDYQSRHQTLFLPPNRKTWLSAKNLVKKNAFWRDLQSLLASGAVRCVIATRNDAADGLECVRLVPPRSYRLARLEKQDVETLLALLTKSDDPANAVVDAPEAGWEQLKERLARDLDKDGAILPVQMRTALRGLAALLALTPRAYDREGALPGIEAATIEQQITNAAMNSGLSKRHVRSLLLALVDRERLKTLSKTEDDLKAAVIADESPADANVIHRGVSIALNYLEDREIVRQRLDPDTRGHVWLLDHDYLSNGILEADRRANVWPSLLQEKHRSFEEAGARPGRKWWALLTPVQQVGLFFQHLRGRLSYGRYRSYALTSLARWAPYVLLVVLCVSGWLWAEERRQAQLDHDEARALLSAIGPADRSELDALWKLAASRDHVRLSFLKQALADPGDYRRINPRAKYVLQALVGLDPVRRENVSKIIYENDNKNYALQSPRIFSAAVTLLATPSARSHKVLLFNVLIEAIDKTTDPYALRVLAEGLKAVTAKLEPADAQKAVAAILAAIDKTTAPYALSELVEGLKAVTAKLEPADAQKAVAAVLAAIDKTTAPYALRALAEGLNAATAKLEPADARKAVAAILAAIDKTTDSFALRALAVGLKAVTAKLEPADARKAVAAILAAIDKPTDPYALSALPEGLKAVTAKLEPADAQKAVATILAAIDKTTAPDALRALAECLKAVPVRVDSAVLMNVAKFPNCVDDLRITVLEIIERENPPAKFEGDVWKLVEWSQQQKPPWDVTSGPNRPTKP